VAQITHRTEDGHLVQVVTPAELRRILLADGDTLDRPAHFAEADEWEPEPECTDLSHEEAERILATLELEDEAGAALEYRIMGYTHRPLDLSIDCTGDDPGARWWECPECCDYAWLAPGQDPPACSCNGSED